MNILSKIDWRVPYVEKSNLKQHKSRKVCCLGLHFPVFHVSPQTTGRG